MTDDHRPTTRPLAGLTPRQERFAREYARSGNAKRSATLAGYSARGAKQAGCALWKYPITSFTDHQETAGWIVTPRAWRRRHH